MLTFDARQPTQERNVRFLFNPVATVASCCVVGDCSWSFSNEQDKFSLSQLTQTPGRSSQRTLRALQVEQPDFDRAPLCDVA